MAGGMEFDILTVAEPDFLAIADRLRRAGEIIAIAQPHHVERFLGWPAPRHGPGRAVVGNGRG